MINCKFCKESGILPITPENDRRSYFLCNHCKLIFVDPKYHPSPQYEINRYLEHHNTSDDDGYIDFLNRLVKPSLNYLNKGMRCLDYGCGHTPVLSELLAKEGISCYNYDPLFNIKHTFDKYDYIFATECFEHFFDPAKELNKIGNLLNFGGFLGIMTEQWESLERFNVWYYKRDFTHVNFFHSDTMAYICRKYGYEFVYRDRNRVVVFQKVVDK